VPIPFPPLQDVIEVQQTTSKFKDSKELGCAITQKKSLRFSYTCHKQK